MPHIAAVASSLKSSSALSPSGDAPAFGDDFAAVLAGLTPKTQKPEEHARIAHAQDSKAADKPQDIVPVQTKPVLRIATSDLKPHAKAQVRDKSTAAPKPEQTLPKPVLARTADEKEDALTEAAAPEVHVTPVRSAEPVRTSAAAKVAGVQTPDEAPSAPIDKTIPNGTKSSPQDAPQAGTRLAANVMQELVASAKGTGTRAVPQHVMEAIAQAVTAQAAPKTAKPAAAEMPVFKQDIKSAGVKSRDGKRDVNTPDTKTSDVKTPGLKTAALAKASAVAQSVIAKAAATVVVIDETPRQAPEAAQNLPAPQTARNSPAPQASQIEQPAGRNALVPLVTPVEAKPEQTAELPEKAASDSKAPAQQVPSAQTAEPVQAAPAQAQAVAVVAPAQTANLAAPETAACVQAQAPPETETDVANVAALASAIAAKSRHGVKMFEIRLDPAELGRVEVHLNVGHDGKAEATLYAERPATLALLQRDSQSLERALKDAGLDVSNSSLNFSLKGQDRQGDGGGASKAHTRTLSNTVVARSEAVNASLAHINLASDGARLDIRV